LRMTERRAGSLRRGAQTVGSNGQRMEGCGSTGDPFGRSN
jgi:hypothetical protein